VDAFLASEEGRWITGQNVQAGGWWREDHRNLEAIRVLPYPTERTKDTIRRCSRDG
jgi:hypothetical protein